MSEVDYSEYCLRELYEAQRNVNRDSYPRNAELIDHWIAVREGKIPEGTPPLPSQSLKPKPDPPQRAEPYPTLPERKPLPPAIKLPVLKVIEDALTLIWTRKFDLLRVLTLPYLLVLLLEYSHLQIVQFVDPWVLFAFSMLSPLVYASFAVTCHRLVLLGKESVPMLGVLVPGGRVFKFWMCTILLSLAVSLGSVIVALPVGMLFEQPWIVLLLVAFPAGYIFSRLSLIFPAIAIDDDRTMERAWLFTRENGVRMMTLVIIPVLPGYLGHYFFGETASLLISGLTLLGGFVVAIIGIVLISLSYRELRDESILGEPESLPMDELGADV